MNQNLQVCNNSAGIVCQVLNAVLVVLIVILAYLLWKIINSPPDAYVDCMVDTYFYGYLKKIVPDNGEEEGGLRDRIQYYKAVENLSDEEFPFYKLFIIITASGFVPSILEKLDPDGRIVLRKDMHPKELNRAGVNKRVYKSSIYQIKFRGQHKHITLAMEGAPPLLCLSDSCRENSDLNKFKKEIIYSFYKKLKAKIEEHDEFEGSCELIFYDDKNNKSLADVLIMKYLDSSA